MHFVVVVVGPDPRAQLDPWGAEYEGPPRDCTDALRGVYEAATTRAVRLQTGELVLATDDRFWRPPRPDELARHRGVPPSRVFDPDEGDDVEVPLSQVVTFERYLRGRGLRPEPDDDAAGWYRRDARGRITQAMYRLCVDGQWDWCCLGGRWKGFFPHRDGSQSDQLRWGDVDVERARREAVDEARAAFAAWERIYEAHGRPLGFQDLHRRHGDHRIARAAYAEQPAIAAFEEQNGMLGCPVAVFGFDRAAYIGAHEARALVPYALVRDGRWHDSEGGLVRGRDDGATWQRAIWEVYDGLDADTEVSAWDCHL
jgi:hypothetical protein